jgi:hypothetical protein
MASRGNAGAIYMPMSLILSLQCHSLCYAMLSSAELDYFENQTWGYFVSLLLPLSLSWLLFPSVHALFPPSSLSIDYRPHAKVSETV